MTVLKRQIVQGLVLGVYLSIVAVGATLVIQPVWMTNDDLTMSWIASGAYTGSPTGLLEFVHAGLGAAISLGYQFVPLVPWYALALILSVVIALGVFGSVLRPALLVGWLPIATVATFVLAVRPNFTATSILLAGVGLALTLSRLLEDRVSVAGIALFFIGALWRLDGAVLAFVLALPLVVITLFRCRGSVSGRKLTFVLGLFPALFLLLNRSASLCFGGQECATWRDYLEFGAIRSTFHTAPRGEVLAALGDPTGVWSASATKLFLNFAYPDSSPFGLAPLAGIDTSFPLYFRMEPGGLVPHVLTTVSDSGSYALLLLAALLLIVVPTALTSRESIAYVIGVAAVSTTSLVILLGVSLVRLPGAVQFGSFLVLVVFWTAMGQSLGHKGYATVSRWVSVSSISLGAVALGAWIHSGVFAVDELKRVSSERLQRSEAFLQNLAGAGPNVVIFGQGNLADYLAVDPYESTPDARGDGVLLSGWHTFSPAFTARKVNLGFSDIYANLAGVSEVGDKAFLFAGSATNALETARLLSELYPDSADYSAEQVARLTEEDDTLVGEVFLWRFQPGR